jgi:signal peptidase I
MMAVYNNSLEKTDFLDKMVLVTERFLTWNRTRRRIKREKARSKNPILDWIEAFLWAAGVVLLINQYLFQAYQIPSGSMIDTLLIGDRIFVNKLVYGPEMLPGLGKLPSPWKPQRNQVIIFENPAYISRGTAFDVVQRLVYMLTLSLVDIDRDPDGQPKAHFLIKRCVGMPGDIWYNDHGNMNVTFLGETRAVSEGDYNTARGWNHHVTRQIAAEDYPALDAVAKAAAYYDLGLEIPPAILQKARSAPVQYLDRTVWGTPYYALMSAANPQDERYTGNLARAELGWYVGPGRVLPMGDNRDNSRDGRYFGPVLQSKVLGQGAFKYWPPGRFGVIR